MTVKYIKEHFDAIIYKGIPGALLIMLAILVAVVVRS